MEHTEYPEFSNILQEMSAMYRGVVFNEFFVSGYWRVLKPYRLSAIRQAIIQLLGDEQRKDMMPSAAEIKQIARRLEWKPPEETFIACQQPHCTELVPWPPLIEGEARMFCSFHRPADRSRVTREEKRAIFAQLSPKGRAYIRSITEVRQLCKDIPVTAEEAQWTELDATIPLQRGGLHLSHAQAAEVYGVTEFEVKEAQAHAAQRTLEHL